MNFINNLKSYEDCKLALIECYGEVELAAEYLRNTKYPDSTIYNLRESVQAVKEGWGSKIMNGLSKHLGGDVSKLDTILKKMDETENKFVDRENKIETEYTQLFREFVHLKFKAQDKSRMGLVQVRLQELESQMREIIRSYNSIMDDLEKEVDIITKGSNRKADYYNLKRSRDSAEAKKRRADNKYKLTKYQDNSHIQQKVGEIFGTPEEAQKEAEVVQNQAQEIQQKVSKYDPGPEWKSIVFRDAEAKMKDAHVVATKYKNGLYEMINQEELNPSANKSEHSKRESSFVAKKGTAIKRIEGKINSVNSLAPDGSTDQLKDAVKYYTEQLDKIKKELIDYQFPPYQGVVKKKKKKRAPVAKKPEPVENGEKIT